MKPKHNHVLYVSILVSGVFEIVADPIILSNFSQCIITFGASQVIEFILISVDVSDVTSGFSADNCRECTKLSIISIVDDTSVTSFDKFVRIVNK